MSVILYGFIYTLVLLSLIFLVLSYIFPRNRYIVATLTGIISFSLLWSTSVWFMDSSKAAEVNIIYAKASFIYALLTAISLAAFSRTLLRLKLKRATIIFTFVYVISCLVLIIGTGVVSGIAEVNGSVVPIRGYYYPLLLLILAGLAVYAIVLLFVRSYRLKHDNAIVSRYLRTVAFSMLLAVAVVVVFSVVLPNVLNNASFSRYVGVTTLIFSMAFMIVVLKRKMLDVQYAATHIIANIISIAAVIVLYYLMIAAISVLNTSQSSLFDTFNTTSAVLLTIMVLVFHPIRSFIARYANAVVLHDRYKMTDFIYRVSNSAVSDDMKSLLHKVSRTLADLLAAEYVLVSIEKIYERRAGVGKLPLITDSDHDKLIYNLKKTKKVIYIQKDDVGVKTGIHSSGITDNNYNAVFAVPLIREHVFLGYILIGRQTGYGYTERDMRALNAVKGEISIAIQNALNLQKVKDLNENLEQRVQDATRKLRRSNERLKKLDATKDEFLSMASHQLRTPLTSVKGYVSMILDEDMGKINDAQREILNEAFTGSERMVRLIGDFLNVSRLQNGKFVIDRVECDLVDVVTHETKSMQQLANTHGINLTFRPPKVFPLLHIDAVKTREVVMNFIDNAIYYTPSGGEVRVKLRVEDGFAVFEVEDTGIGVPKAMQKQLFTKFYRADNARKKRPDGTGVGIYLAKRVIEAQQGHVIFRSVENKGSTFGFRLPIKDTLKEK